MADTAPFQYGRVVYPLEATSPQSTLRDLDPAVYYAIDYFRGALQTNLGARWATACAAANRTDIAGAIVQSTVSNNPEPQLVGSQIKLPSLAIYRVKGTSKSVNNVDDGAEGDLELVYVLPPLSLGEAEQLTPFLHAVYHVVSIHAWNGSDSAFHEGADLPDLAGVEWFSVSGYEYGNFLTKGDIWAPAIKIHLTATEYSSTPDGALDEAESIDTSLDLDNQDGIDPVFDFVETAIPDQATEDE